MRRVDSLEKTLMLGGIGGRRRRDDRGWDGWMASLTRGTWVWVNSWTWWWTGRPGVLRFMGSQRVGHYWETELNWTDPELACHWRTHLLTQLVPSLRRALDGNSVEEGHGVCSIKGTGACHPGKGERVVTDVVWICLVKIWLYSNWSYCFMFIVCKLCYCFKFSRDTVALYCLYSEWITPTTPPWG